MEKAFDVSAFVVVLLVLLVFVYILSWPTQYLWNDLMPSIFGLRRITLRESFELLLLSSLLFKPPYSSNTSK